MCASRHNNKVSAMTFYNVISALLFLGAFREVLLAVDSVSWPRIWMAGCLATIVFNDMLSTSHWVETGPKITYSWKLMLIDLLNFCLLSIALVAISPLDNLFNAKVARLGTLLSEAVFWWLLATYWLFLMLWTRLGGLPLAGNRIKFSLLVAILFAAVGVLCHCAAPDSLIEVGRCVAFAYVTGYILSRMFVDQAAEAAARGS